MTDERIIEVLTEDVNEEILKRLPVWYRRLREAYAKRRLCTF